MYLLMRLHNLFGWAAGCRVAGRLDGCVLLNKPEKTDEPAMVLE
jgi:hypothetical protein